MTIHSSRIIVSDSTHCLRSRGDGFARSPAGRYSLIIVAVEDVSVHELPLGVSTHQEFVYKRWDIFVMVCFARSEDDSHAMRLLIIACGNKHFRLYRL